MTTTLAHCPCEDWELETNDTIKGNATNIFHYFYPSLLQLLGSLQLDYKNFVLFLLVLTVFRMSGDLSSLVARLEAVTSRLETAADKASGGQAGMKLVSTRKERIKIKILYC